MRWSRGAWRCAGLSLILAFGLALLLLASPPEEKLLTVYTPRVTYSVPVLDRSGSEYVGLVEILEPLCGVSAGRNRDTWKLRCDKLEAQFKVGGKSGKIGDRSVELPGRFLLENDRGLVPLRSLESLLPLFTALKTELHAPGRRVFLDDVAIRFTPELRSDALLLNFSAPVNPVISTEPGKLKMTFRREPVVSGASAFRYESALAPTLTFSESNGRAELTVNSSVPLLAAFSDGSKTITLTAAPAQAAAVPSTQQPVSPAPSGESPASENQLFPPPPPPLPAKPQPVVVLDASHGGEERGAALTDKLAEKDVTLSFARRLRYELQVRGVPTLMARDSDATLTVDQRAMLANSSRTLLFITIHAGSVGHGVRLYTAMLSPVSGTAPHGPFRPWDTAQTDFLVASRSVAGQVSAELAKREVQVAILPGAVRPLNNVAAPAFALELTPSENQVDAVTSSRYQQTVALAVATAVAAARTRLEQQLR